MKIVKQFTTIKDQDILNDMDYSILINTVNPLIIATRDKQIIRVKQNVDCKCIGWWELAHHGYIASGSKPIILSKWIEHDIVIFLDANRYGGANPQLYNQLISHLSNAINCGITYFH